MISFVFLILQCIDSSVVLSKLISFGVSYTYVFKYFNVKKIFPGTGTYVEIAKFANFFESLWIVMVIKFSILKIRFKFFEN